MLLRGSLYDKDVTIINAKKYCVTRGQLMTDHLKFPKKQRRDVFSSFLAVQGSLSEVFSLRQPFTKVWAHRPQSQSPLRKIVMWSGPKGLTLLCAPYILLVYSEKNLYSRFL